jgi:hypothetical protein
MNARHRQYLFGVIFLGFGIYQLVLKDVLEASLYMVAGAAFIFNTVASEPGFSKYKKVLVAITWVLIVTAGLLFLYLLQFKFL